MFGKYLKNLFTKKKDKAVQVNTEFFTPLRIGLHSTIEINVVDWVVIQQNLNDGMKIPKGKMNIQAIGELSNNITRIYMADEDHEEFILQLFIQKNNDNSEEVVEASLFKQVAVSSPASEESWDKHLADIGQLNYYFGGAKYDRTWGDEYTEQLDLIVFDETIHTRQGDTQGANHYMLYSRKVENPIGDEATELLLIGAEETEGDGAEFVIQVGLDISVQSITIQ